MDNSPLLLVPLRTIRVTHIGWPLGSDIPNGIIHTMKDERKVFL
jgi:hypothetical protein